MEIYHETRGESINDRFKVKRLPLCLRVCSKSATNKKDHELSEEKKNNPVM